MMCHPVQQSIKALGVLLFIIALGAAGAVYALPTEVTVTPPNGARFVVGQKFDLRVEGRGVGPFSGAIAVDGVPLRFTSGEQNSLTTDGITAAGYGGFNMRGYSNFAPGTHTITATFTDSTGTVKVTSKFRIIEIKHLSGHPFVGHPFTHGFPESHSIKNIIIMVGDGMGVAHRTAARIVRYGVSNGTSNDYLAMDKFPGTGLVTTHSLNSIITDSAPGMSGYVTGNHQNNNQEGVFPSHVTNPFFGPRVEYLSEFLHRTQGKSLGIVTTADIEDATPAANAVHTANRGAGTGICDQYLDQSDFGDTRRFGTGLRVLMGGGRRWFLPAGQFGSSRAASTDYPALPADLVNEWNLHAAGASDPDRDLIDDFKNAGFAYADSATALNGIGTPNKLLGLFGFGNMNVALDKIAKRRGTPLPGSTSFVVDDYRAPDQPMLDEMTAAALRVLARDRDGFVLMVEGAHIDKQSHAMDAERAIGDTLEFDRAVEVARRFADKADDTLIIVLADHECSGFSIIGALAGTVENLQNLPSDNLTLDPGAQPERQKLVGAYDVAGFPKYKILDDGYPENFDINGKLLIGYGASGDRFETWLMKPIPIRDSLLPTDLSGELTGKGYTPTPADRASDKSTGYFLRGQAIGRDQAVHTASDIPISAYSTGGKAFELFYGVQENTDIFFKLIRAATGAY
ncbi:MAG TPA: alkaline phosphatase [Blastocatellia bacterium]|nr:alkaline phosphatase [Blastocatellia bacterium]